MIKLTKDRQDLGIWLDNRERSFMRLALQRSSCTAVWGTWRTLVSLNELIGEIRKIAK